MNKLWMAALVLAMLAAAGYVGQAQNAMVALSFRLGAQLKQGSITQQQYDEQIKENTFGRILRNPGKVLFAGRET